MLTASVEKKVNQIINVYETGKKDGDYGLISIYNDGSRLRADKKQITFGAKQTTEEYSLRQLIEMYVNMKGAKHAAYFKKKLPLIGKTSLVDDETFIATLKKSGSDPIMIKAQDLFFEIEYGTRAKVFFSKNEFTLALSYAVIFDSTIHSGRIREDIRNMFTEVPPNKGGNEKKWVTEYVKSRKEWLISKGIQLSKTIYRMDAFLDAIEKDNWDLEKPFNANGIIV